MSEAMLVVIASFAFAGAAVLAIVSGGEGGIDGTGKWIAECVSWHMATETITAAIGRWRLATLTTIGGNGDRP